MNQEKFTEYMTNLKNTSRENWIPVVRDETLNILFSLLMIRKPKKILEIGTAVGYSSIMFADKLKYISNLKITTVDIDEKNAIIAKNNIKDVGFDNIIDVITSDASCYMQKLIDANKSFDFIFIDANKSKYKDYLEFSKKLCNRDTIIVFDNVLLSGWVTSDYNEHKHRTQVNKLREFLKYVSEDKTINSQLISIEDGILICTLKQLKY